MKIVAELNYLRMAPRKVRVVADAIRGKRVPEAERALHFIARRAARPLAKLLKSAVANAKRNFRVSGEDLLAVSEVTVNEGPVLKRRRPRAFGRAFPIAKRTSHVRLVLEAKEAPLRRGVRKPAIDVVQPADSRDSEKISKPREEREAFKARPKVATKTTEFVRRMFRRKAI